jgi:hypothetical protein
MRRVHARLKHVLIAVVLVSALTSVGCGSSSSDTITGVKPGSGVALNPSGKPQNDAQAAYASQMQKTGAAMNATMQQSTAAMAAAKARSGGQ